MGLNAIVDFQQLQKFMVSAVLCGAEFDLSEVEEAFVARERSSFKLAFSSEVAEGARPSDQKRDLQGRMWGAQGKASETFWRHE